MASKKPSGANSVSPLKALIVAALKGGGRAGKQSKSGRKTAAARGPAKAQRSGKRG